MSQSLKYLDYQKRRIAVLIKGEHMLNNPINFKGIKIYQVCINKENEVMIHHGADWAVTNDENLLYCILESLTKPDFQKKIDFREAV